MPGRLPVTSPSPAYYNTSGEAPANVNAGEFVTSPSPAYYNTSAQVFVDDINQPEISSEDMHHLVNVLRLREGEKIVLSDGKGYWRLCSFSKTHWNSRLRKLSEDIHKAEAPLRPTCIALAMAKGERGTWAIAKLVELGIDHIILLSTDRGVVRWDTTRKKHALGRLRRVARESSAQSRRAFLPRIDGPVTLDELLEADRPHELALTDITGESMLSTPQEISTIATGPEGGWSQRELSLAKENYIPLLSLGATIMRSETAAIAAGVILKGWRIWAAGTQNDAQDR